MLEISGGVQTLFDVDTVLGIASSALLVTSLWYLFSLPEDTWSADGDETSDAAAPTATAEPR